MKVVVADGQSTTRLGLEGLLLATEARVMGECEDGEEALRLVEETDPDLVILGLDLSGKLDGVEACRRLKSLPDPPRVLVHTAYDFAYELSRCLLVEADGYVHKRACYGELLDAIRATAAGERVWLPRERVGKPYACTTDVDLKTVVELTGKEREVLELMAGGCPNREIAAELHLSLPTIKTHVRSILRKFEAETREDLFRGALDQESSKPSQENSKFIPEG